MKHILLLSATALACFSLAACGQTSHHSTASSSSTSSKVVHHKKRSKSVRKRMKKQTQSSSSSSSSVSNSQQSSQNSSNTQQSNQNSQGQQTKSSQPSQDPSADNLHDFVNKYGESPAAYKMEHDGMSAHDALMSTPNDMKTSGEIQDTYMYQKGQDPFAGN